MQQRRERSHRRLRVWPRWRVSSPSDKISRACPLRRCAACRCAAAADTLCAAGHTDRVWQVSWAPSGNELASCSGDSTVRIVSSQWQARCKRVASDSHTQLWCAQWQRDAAGTWKGESVLENVHQRTIRSVAYSPCGRYLATASFDATTAIWERQQGVFECIATLEGHENEVKSVSWASSGALLATCSRDKTVWIWAADGDHDFECAAVLTGHSQDVKSVVFHPYKELAVSASYDDTLKVWVEDDEDWYCCDTATGHTSTVWSAAFNAEGDRLISGSDDLQLKLWRLVEVRHSCLPSRALTSPGAWTTGSPQRHACCACSGCWWGRPKASACGWRRGGCERCAQAYDIQRQLVQEPPPHRDGGRGRYTAGVQARRGRGWSGGREA